MIRAEEEEEACAEVETTDLGGQRHNDSEMDEDEDEVRTQMLLKLIQKDTEAEPEYEVEKTVAAEESSSDEDIVRTKRIHNLSDSVTNSSEDEVNQLEEENNVKMVND